MGSLLVERGLLPWCPERVLPLRDEQLDPVSAAGRDPRRY